MSMHLTPHPLQHNLQYRRLRRQLNRLRGAGYAVVAAAAVAAAVLQPPHAGDVEVGTVRVAAGDLSAWVDGGSTGR